MEGLIQKDEPSCFKTIVTILIKKLPFKEIVLLVKKESFNVDLKSKSNFENKIRDKQPECKGAIF